MRMFWKSWTRMGGDSINSKAKEGANGVLKGHKMGKQRV